MKLDKKGFIGIECIISLAIIGLVVYIISSALKDNYIIASKNETKIQMLNIAKSNLENIKYEIKFVDGFKQDEIIKDIDGYLIIKNIENIEKNNQCYKVCVEVKKDTESINLVSYVFKQ